MDAKITKVRLNRMLSYDWIKIIAVAVAAIIVWTLIFTMTSTRITPAQQFTVMNYLGNAPLNLKDSQFDAHYQSAFSKGVFSYEVLETTKVDLASNASMAGELLSTRTATKEGDVIFVANADDLDSEIKDEEGNVTGYGNTYLEEFARGYFSMLYEVDGYVQSMENYLKDYYKDGDWQDESKLNEELVKSEFRTRVKKDKRFKTKKQIAEGETWEIERIKKYAKALDKFQGWLADGTVSYADVVIKEADENGQGEEKKTYAINLCPKTSSTWTTDQEEKLSKLVSYKGMVEDTETGTKVETDKLVEDMCVCLFHFDGVADGFQYESMLYIVSVVEYALAA